MDNIFEISCDFNFDDIHLANPIPLTGGSYYTKVTIGNYAKNLYLQLPKATSKQGIMKNNSRSYCDLMFNTSEKELIDWLEKFESHCQQSILKKRELWFHNDLNLQDIEEMMNPIMRSYKSGKNILVRTLIKNGKCNIYDENENILDLSALTVDLDFIPLINLDGIKFSAKTFQIEINLIQVMILLPQKDFEKNCLINRNNLNKKTLSHKITGESLVPVLHDSLGEKMDETNGDEKDRDETNREKIDETDGEKIDETDGEKMDKRDHDERDSEKNDKMIIEPLLVSLEETIIEKNQDNELQEIELDIQDLEEPVILKDQSLIYLEIYKQARKKAKELRQNALHAYLEAKKIKTKYRLDELDDRDDDDEYDDYILDEYQNEYIDESGEE